jgi:hypothetical protein
MRGERARIAMEMLAWAHRRPVPDATVLQRWGDEIRRDPDWFHQRRIDSIPALASRTDPPSQRVYDRILAMQLAAARKVLEELYPQARTLVFKGAEILSRGFDRRALGCIADCDLLVERARLGTARAVLFGQGFRQGQVERATRAYTERDVREIATIEGSHYELAPFSKLVPLELDEEEKHFVGTVPQGVLYPGPDGCLLKLEIDVHWGVAANVDSVQLFERAVPSTLGIGEAVSPTDHLWLCAARLYSEVALHKKQSLRDFAYLIRLLGCDVIDWEVILAAAANYHARIPLYYYLEFLDRLAGRGAVPPEVCSALHPLRGARGRDWGWQLGSLFDTVDPFPIPECP